MRWINIVPCNDVKRLTAPKTQMTKRLMKKETKGAMAEGEIKVEGERECEERKNDEMMDKHAIICH